VKQLGGYHGLGPVRIGNDAHQQAQHDIYGEVVLTVYDFVERVGLLGRIERKLVAGFGKAVLELWREPDQGIWEIRLPPRHNTHSKLMCWTALDRLLKLNDRIGLPIDAARLSAERQAIRDDIERNAFDESLGSYVGYYGGKAPDATLLLMARYGYIPADDPRMVNTYRRVERELGVDGLLYRYPPGGSYDGVPGGENLFGICTFWLIDYLARLGEIDKAEKLFERMLGYANDVGLYAEELDAKTKAPRGNFPQAFTHVGLITAALAVDQAQRGKRDKEIAR
jgi:GH15 family glucan-1,4-alpha-glucosidase